MKKTLTLAFILALAGCGGAANKSAQNAATAASSADLAIVDSKAPLDIVAIVDKDGKVVSTRATNDAAVGATAEEVAAYETSKAQEGKISIVNSDKDVAENSTESCFSWNSGYYPYGYGSGYA